MWSIELPVLRATAEDKTAKPFQRKLTSRSDVKGRRPCWNQKKGTSKLRRAFQQNVWQLLVGPSL
jgi:hypothetical protein